MTFRRDDPEHVLVEEYSECGVRGLIFAWRHPDGRVVSVVDPEPPVPVEPGHWAYGYLALEVDGRPATKDEEDELADCVRDALRDYYREVGP